nr:ribonuclease H-like domain-containing protein [Tanacetum cinerariifolium]
MRDPTPSPRVKGLGGYDWIDQAEEGPTNYALMAYSTSSALSLDSENASKSLNKIIECQIIDHYEKRLRYNAVPPPHIGLFPPLKYDLSYTVLEELFNEPKTEKSKDKSNDVEPESVRKGSDALIIEDWVLDDEEEKVEQKEVKPSINWINFVKATIDNNPKEKVKNDEQPKQNTHSKRGNQRNWNRMMSHRLGSNWEMFNKSCYECGSFEHLIRNYQHHQNKIKQQKVLKPMWNNSQRVNHKNHFNAKRNHVPQVALTVNAARPITAVHPKRIMNVNTGKLKAAVNAAKAKTKHKAVKGKRGNAVKASACWIKTVNDDVWLQALIDGKKVVINEASIRHDLKLNDVEGTSCLSNAIIFEELARMRYEKPYEKLTFYKTFFSPQWKFLIHTILQCLSAKTTSWNEFSSTMASAIICLANNQKFNFSKYILSSLVKNLEAGVPFYIFPSFGVDAAKDFKENMPRD